MDKLLNPDPGLIIWTIATFLALVFILMKFAWKPLLKAIEERERKIKSDLSAADAARAEARRLEEKLGLEIAGLDAKAREMMAKVSREGEDLRSRLKTQAEVEARSIRERTMAELSEEKERLVRELRSQVADLSVLAAERLLRRSVDDKVQKTVLETFFKDIDGKRKN